MNSRKRKSKQDIPYEKIICYWAILSTRSPAIQSNKSNLAILHLDQTLEELLGSSVQMLNGISVLNFIHPNEARQIEMEIAQYTSERRAKNKVLRCMMKSVTSIVSYAQSFFTGYSLAQLKDDDYQLTDIRLELIGDGMMLCFFHAVEGMVKRNDDDCFQGSSCCKTMLNTFNDQHCQKLWQHIFSEKMIETSSSKIIERHWNGFPKKIFQILSNVSHSNVLFSWPPPRIFDSMQQQQQQQQHHYRSKSNSDIYIGGNNYSANDFARLTCQSTFREILLARPEELTTCKQSQSLSFNVLIDGLDIDLDAIVIPHGEIKFAIFSIHKADICNDWSKDEKIFSPITFDRGLTSPFSTIFPEKCNQLLSAHVPPNYMFSMSLPSSSSLIPTLIPRMAQHESLINVKADPSKYGIQTHSHMNPVAYEDIATTSKAVSLQTQAEVESGDRKEVGHKSIYEYQKNEFSSSSSSSSSLPSFPLTFTTPSTSTNMNSTTMMKKCLTCGTLDSPEWRKGPDGKKSLCNACGLRFSRDKRRRKKKEENAKMANEVAANDGTIPAHIRNRIEDERNKKKVELSKKTKNINSKPPPQSQQQQLKANKDGMDALTSSSTMSNKRSSLSMHASSSKMNLNTNPHHLPENTSLTSDCFSDHEISIENMFFDVSPYLSVYQNSSSESQM